MHPTICTFSVSDKRCPRTNQVDGHVWEVFQRCGPAAVKTWSPRQELVLITVYLKLSDDRSWWRLVVATSQTLCWLENERSISLSAATLLAGCELKFIIPKSKKAWLHRNNILPVKKIPLPTVPKCFLSEEVKERASASPWKTPSNPLEVHVMAATGLW